VSGKQTIFISSVQKELAQERRAVKDFVQTDPLLSRFFDVFLFEDLPAADARADTVYLSEVDHCALYLGLFGNDYGFEDAQGKSPTEHEFDRATALGKPRLIYVRGTDDTARHAKMRALVRKAGDQLIRRRFASTAELTAAVNASLVEHLARTGALRTSPFDATACAGATLADLSPDKLALFLARAQSQRGFALDPATPLPNALMHLSLLDAGQPTHAAVLLFGQAPQRFLPSSEVKCMHFHGTQVSKPIPSYHVYKGTVFELVDQALDFVLSKIARTVGTRAAGAQAPVDYELPREAVAEAIVNAVAHRDYASNASVQVMLFADRLEIWNPGELPPQLTVDNLRRPHASIPRSPHIAEPLFLARYIEKAGTGTLDMIHLCAQAGLPAPEFRQDGGQFIQTLWRPKAVSAPDSTEPLGTKSGTKSGPSRDQVQILAKASTGAALTELMAIDGRTNRTKFRDQVIRPLLLRGWLEMTLPDKPTSRLQKYRLTPEGAAWVVEWATKGPNGP
jgi:predicted HTH transcriptional regulator